MSKTFAKVFCTALLATSLGGFGIPAQAQSPFDAQPVTPRTNAGTTASQAPAAIDASVLAARSSNAFATSDYQNWLVSFAVIQGTISFTDETSDYQRYSWLKQIFAEHGVQIVADNSKDGSTGSFFNKKKFKTVSITIKGRGFVLKAIKDYYGGTLAGDPGQPLCSPDAALKDIVAAELDNQKIELQILQASFELDRLIIARSKLGALALGDKSRNDKAQKDIKENQIPGLKAKLAANRSKIMSTFTSLAEKAIADKNFARAIDLIKASGDTGERSTYMYGQALQGQAQWDPAIGKYRPLVPSNTYGERAQLGIADCQHGKGDDRAALDTIYGLLNNYTNSSAQQGALARVDQWGLLKKTAQYPELPGKISQAYVAKALLDNANAHSTAVADYKRAVEIRANSGDKAAASKAILDGFSSIQSQYAQSLNTAKAAADKRFGEERARAQGEATAWRQAYDRAVSQADIDYRYDLSRKRQDLDAAQRQLDYLLAHPPAPTPTTPGGTDPYGGNNGGNSGGTDPYSGGTTKPKPNTNTDPYGGSSNTGTNSGTDPYATKPKTNTDPYATPSSGKYNPADHPRDPVTGQFIKKTTPTDPYGSQGGTTDPYAGGQADYDAAVRAARDKVARLNNDYSWLYYNRAEYVAQKTQNERYQLQQATDKLARYDYSKRDAYIANDAEVKRFTQLTGDAARRVSTLQGLAKEAGY